MLNVKTKPLQLHVQKYFSHGSTEDVRNQRQLLELHLCADTTAVRTCTVLRKTVKAGSNFSGAALRVQV